MAKKSRVEPEGKRELCLRLFEPGMTFMHRAGLGGLACALRYVERLNALGLLSDDELPGNWTSGAPWTIEKQFITLRFERDTEARSYLERLFKLVFQIKDGLIYIPSQYPDELPIEVRAELQQGLILTFLQHGKVRDLAKESLIVQFDPIGDGSQFTTEFKACSKYKHQEGYLDLVDGKGRLTSSNIEIAGPLNPGAVVRHNAFPKQTKLDEPAAQVISLYFAMIGCIALSINRGSAALLVPEVKDLTRFAVDRPFMTPTSARECRVASGGDAVLQAQLRIRSRGLLESLHVPSCHVVVFAPTKWSTQQKSRIRSFRSELSEAVWRHEPIARNDEERRLRRFELAMACLPARVALKSAVTRLRQNEHRREDIKPQAFWAESVVRPLIADNLATGRRWYEDFVTLMYKKDLNNVPLRLRLGYETKGLHEMMSKVSWDSKDSKEEEVLVLAVQAAIRSALGKIRNEVQGTQKGSLKPETKNRWNRFRERLRLGLVGAKSSDQCRAELCRLFSAAGRNEPLQENWRAILPLLVDEGKWRMARDLALLALASYRSKGTTETSKENELVQSTEI